MLQPISRRVDRPWPCPLPDRIHYACGKNVMPGWLNVDGFDISYPDGTIDPQLVEQIFPVDLAQKHPFPDNHFRFGYSEDFLEHLTQAESLLFLAECQRTTAPGGVLRLSFPGLAGVLLRHFSGKTFEEILQGVKDAYTLWPHEHFYCAESITLVARHLGFREVTVHEYGRSPHPALNNLETRPDQRDLNLVVELVK